VVALSAELVTALKLFLPLEGIKIINREGRRR